MNAFVVSLLVMLAVVAGVVMWFVANYNRIIKLRNQLKNAWSQIDVQLKRRHDLIPNLVETVKGYAGHEKETLQGVIEARSKATSASGVQDQAKAESALSGALGRLMMVVEQYPDLQANENYLALQEELTSTENKVAFSRQAFNDSVTQYNTNKQTFPTVAFAGMFGHANDAAMLEFDSQQIAEAPKVSF